MSVAFWLILLFVVLVVGFTLYFLLARGAGSNSSQKPITLDKCDPSTGPIVLPLIPDRNNGVYRSEITLGNELGASRISLVPDTGSSTLIVSSKGCEGCPTQDGEWNPEYGRLANPGTIGTIRFGGGQVSHYVPTIARLMNPQTGTGREVIFGAIVDTYSPDGRSMNVMGLQEKAGGFLASICGDKSVLFDFPGQQLILGKSDDIVFNPNNKFLSVFSMKQPPTGVQFPLATIQSMKVDGIEIPANLLPQVAILDTGTTDTFIPRSLAPYLQGGNHKVEILFEGVDGQPNLPITFNSPSTSISIDTLPLPRSLMIGNGWMQSWAVQFNHDQDRFVIFQK